MQLSNKKLLKNVIQVINICITNEAAYFYRLTGKTCRRMSS